MAKYSTFMRAYLLTILFILSVHVSGLDGSRNIMHARINSRAILRELGYDLPNKVPTKHCRREMEDRKAPGGPDPQHNSGPPGSSH